MGILSKKQENNMKNLHENTDSRKKTINIKNIPCFVRKTLECLEYTRNPQSPRDQHIQPKYISEYCFTRNLHNPTEIVLLAKFMCSWLYFCNPQLITKILESYGERYNIDIINRFMTLNKEYLDIALLAKDVVIPENRPKPYTYHNPEFNMTDNYFYPVDNYDMLLLRENLITLLLRNELITENIVDNFILPFPDTVILYLFRECIESMSDVKNSAALFLIEECLNLISKLSNTEEND